MQGCKIYKLCIVADLIEMCFRIDKIVDGQAKLLASVSVAMPRQGAKALLIECSLSKVLLRYFRRK